MSSLKDDHGSCRFVKKKTDCELAIADEVIE
jgi:hypothetical protein